MDKVILTRDLKRIKEIGRQVCERRACREKQAPTREGMVGVKGRHSLLLEQ